MANIKKWIDEFLKEHKLTWKDIKAVHLGDKGWSYTEEKRATVIKPLEARKLLDYEFDSGFGGEEGHRFFIYLKDWILIKSEYDGSECMKAIPRKPNKEVRPFSV